MGRKSANHEYELFKDLIERVNYLPASPAEIEEFYSYMDPILELFQKKGIEVGILDSSRGDKKFTEEDEKNQMDRYRRWQNAFGLRVEETRLKPAEVLPVKFRALAKFVEPISPQDMRNTVKNLQVEREILVTLIAAADDKRRGGWGYTKITRTSRVWIDDSFKVIEAIHDPLTLIQDKGASIARIGICPECGLIFWKKIDRQTARKTVTCGKPSCVTRHSNSKRSKKENK